MGALPGHGHTQPGAGPKCHRGGRPERGLPGRAQRVTNHHGWPALHAAHRRPGALCALRGAASGVYVAGASGRVRQVMTQRHAWRLLARCLHCKQQGQQQLGRAWLLPACHSAKGSPGGAIVHAHWHPAGAGSSSSLFSLQPLGVALCCALGRDRKKASPRFPAAAG